jgi:hypothetical protein
MSMTTACFSVKPMPSYNGILKTAATTAVSRSVNLKAQFYEIWSTSVTAGGKK